VAAFKRPTHVFVRLEALPRTSTRKVRKALLRDWLERQTEVGA
jgi:acyl-coenzyme A synthetase/AMP-(fatty) acid ligase